MATEQKEITVFSSNDTVRAKEQPAFQEEHAITELISARLPFVVRWGTLFFFLLLCVLGLFTWFIQYPDVVTARAKLSSVNPPREIITKVSGRILQLQVSNGQPVTAGTLLGVLECIAQPGAVDALKQKADTIYRLIQENRTDEITAYVPEFVQSAAYEQLGELQPEYETFIRSLISFKDYIQSGFYLRKKQMLAADEQYLQQQHQVLLQQKALLEEDIAVSNETFQANEGLYRDKVIAPLDYRNEKSKFIIRKLSLPQVQTALNTNQAQRHEKKKEIAELENQIEVQKNQFIQTLQTLRNKIAVWESNYLLRASVTGKVVFQGFLQEQQQVKAGQTLMYVMPGNTEWFAEVLVPQYNFGKVHMGQWVQLKMHAYPYVQYGEVKGIVDLISPTPSDSGFLVKVALPATMRTNRNIAIQYRHGLTAEAQIITQNRRLLERFVEGLWSWRSM